MGYATPLLTERYKWLYEASDTDIDTHNTEYTQNNTTSYTTLKELSVDRIHSESVLRLVLSCGGVADSGGTIYIRVLDQDDNILVPEHSDATPASSSNTTADITFGDITSFKLQAKASINGQVSNVKNFKMRGTLIGQYANIDFPTLEEV